MANLTTAIGMENEIVTQEDVTFGYDASVSNVITVLNSFLTDGKKNIVIGGKVEPYSGGGMNIQLAPVFALNGSERYACIDTDVIAPVSVEESDVTQNRMDTVQIRAKFVEYDRQIRQFQDPNLKIKTTEEIPTKKKWAVDVFVKSGTPGSAAAPEADEGYIKIAEILVPAGVNYVSAANIRNVVAIHPGEENAQWTNEKDVTYAPGYVYDLLPKFYRTHLSDGTIKSRAIKENMIDFGTETSQVKGSSLPAGKSINIHGEGTDSNTNIADMLITLAEATNSLFRYSNDILGRYRFASVVPVATSTDNIDLSQGGAKTIDGVLCSAGNAVLLVGQEDARENGLYKVGTTWARHEGYDSSKPDSLCNTLFVASQGQSNKGKVFYCKDDLVRIGVDDIVMTESIMSPNNTARTVMVRDSNGRARVSDPVDDKDIVNKGFVSTLLEAAKEILNQAITAVQTALTTHVNNKSNPHEVTKSQVGLGNVDNTADSAKTVSKANQLTTARNIDGVSFNGSASIVHWGTCDTAAVTQAKVVSCAGFSLSAGSRITVKFTNGNTSGSVKGSTTTNQIPSASAPTMNVNGTGAKQIKVGGEFAGENFINAGDVHDFVYDGTYWNDVTADVIYRGGDDTNGHYVKKRNGSLEQSGIQNFVKSVAGGDYATGNVVTYPVRFSENFPCVTLTHFGGNQFNMVVTNYQTYEFYPRYRNINYSNSASTSGCFWYAVGR